MTNILQDKYIKTTLGTFKISVRPRKTLVVFLSGFGPYDTAQIFDPIIKKVPNQIGILALDYLDSGLSSASTRTFGLPEEAKLITTIIQAQNAKKIIFVAHSLGGLYALLIAQKIKQTSGFIGIEPTNKEILLSPPNEPAYRKAEEEDAALTTDDINKLMYQRIYTSFSKKLADQIWTTSLQCQKADKENVAPHGLELSLDIFKTGKFSNLKLDANIPTILFMQPYRIAEYKRSEFYTKDTSIMPLGKNHYIHFEFSDDISAALQSIIDKISH